MSTYFEQKPGIRYERRVAPKWMYENLENKKCWCGKPKEDFNPLQRKYCTFEHSQIWQFRLTCYWETFRHMICFRDKGFCKECNIQVVKFPDEIFQDCYWRGHDLIDWEADHILAISLGGMCFDPLNVRTLCSDCHKIKTASDLRTLSFFKRASDYDPTLIEKSSQKRLSDF